MDFPEESLYCKDRWTGWRRRDKDDQMGQWCTGEVDNHSLF